MFFVIHADKNVTDSDKTVFISGKITTCSNNFVISLDKIAISV